jgi:hypothetical protein
MQMMNLDTSLDVIMMNEKPLIAYVDSGPNDYCDEFKGIVRSYEQKRYLSRGSISLYAVPMAILPVPDSFEEYKSDLKGSHKGNILREIRHAEQKGYFCDFFVYQNFLPDIVEINHSLPIRSGGPMRGHYLLSLDELGGPPKELLPFDPPKCFRHFHVWCGVFLPVPGHMQGQQVVDRRLVGYVKFTRIGNWCMYNQILGHGQFVRDGIMYLLHYWIMKKLFSKEFLSGIKFVTYGGWNHGNEGLIFWKRKTLFQPGYLVDQNGMAV